PSALHSFEVDDDTALTSDREVWVVVPYARVANRLPLIAAVDHAIHSSRTWAIDRGEHLNAPDEHVAVTVPRLLTRTGRNSVDRPRLFLPRRGRISIRVQRPLDAVLDRESLSNAAHHDSS